MGNYMSCSIITYPTMKSSKAARIILPGGEVRQFHEPIKAAELMLEFPNHFLVNSMSLNVGKRFSALSADEDLEFGNFYIMFPMKRVNSLVTAADMAVVLMSANCAAKRISFCGGDDVERPPPVVATEVAAEGVVDGSQTPSGVGDKGLDDSEDMQGFAGFEFKYRTTACRSRKPLLDTILEESVFSR